MVTALKTDAPARTAFMEFRRSAYGTSEVARPSDWVSLDQVSPFVIGSVVGAEDPLFFQHHGIWWNQLKIATLQSLVYKRPVRGVSTITQQLARNLFLAPDRTIRRKLGEALLAKVLEWQLGKRRILELYLNIAEWGDGIWGIESASQHYCQRSAKALNAFQAIVLVSLLPAPRAPLIGRNADRARWAQQRLPRFLYSTGLLNLNQFRAAKQTADRLFPIFNAGTPLNLAMAQLSVIDSNAGANDPAPVSVYELLRSHCGWTGRLRFEQFLEQHRGKSDEPPYPLWWCEPNTQSHAVRDRLVN